MGLGFIYVGYHFFFRGKIIIQWIQKHKFNTVAQPRNSEIVMSKIIGVILFLIGLFYSGIAILSFF